jgi:phosphate uptake regulator
METKEQKLGDFLFNMLVEERRSDLPYQEKKTKNAIDKVIVTLSGNESGKFTKLANIFKKLREQTDELSAATDALNTQIKEEAVALFDATDEVYTRIVETASMTILIGKRQPDTIETTEVKDYEKIIKDITALAPQLSEQIAKIIKANTEITSKTKVARAPQLRVNIKEDFSFGKLFAGITKTFNVLLKSIRGWGRTYDTSLSEIKSRIDDLIEA